MKVCKRCLVLSAANHRNHIQLFTSMQTRIQPFTLMRIRIQILLIIKVMWICDHWSIDHSGLHFEPPGLHCKRQWLYFKSIKLLYSNADPIQAQLQKMMLIHADLDTNLWGPCWPFSIRIPNSDSLTKYYPDISGTASTTLVTCSSHRLGST